MAFLFDLYGWYAGEAEPGKRTTDVKPPTLSLSTTPGQDRANWTGYKWEVHPYKPPPAPDPIPVDVRHVTPLAFRNRFTLEEKVRYEMAALDDPQADKTVRAVAAALRAAQHDVAAAQFIDLEKPEIRQRVLALESYGVLDEGRGLEILDDKIRADELP